MTVAAVVVGAGNASRLWLPTLTRLDRFDLRALVDADVELARERAAEQGVAAPVLPDLSSALAERAPELVIDLTPPGNRLLLAAQAFDAGCDVFCEKPLATSIAAARELVELADARGRRLWVMQNRRHHPAMRALRRAIADGLLGDLILVAADFYKDVDPTGHFIGTMPSPLLADMAIHTFDQARYLVGADPIDVTAHEWNPPGSRFAGDASAVCTFRFPREVTFSYRGSWVASGQETTWFSTWRIIGTRGTAAWDGDGEPVVEVVEDGRARPVRLPDSAGDPNDHPAAIPAMLAAYAAGLPGETVAGDNIRSLAMVHAALEASRTGGAYSCSVSEQPRTAAANASEPRR